MKKLLLLSALLILACNSDDSSDTNDNSNQTFLERFDGVVWESQESGTRRVFFNSPPSTGYDVIIDTNNGQYGGCVLSIFGIEDEDEYLYELLENNFDNLRVKVTDIILNEYVIWNVTVSSNDNILIVDGNNAAIRTDLQLICQ
jgi:hypothetical protein